MIQDALRSEFGGSLHKNDIKLIMRTGNNLVAAASSMHPQDEETFSSEQPSSSNIYDNNENNNVATRKAHSPYVLAKYGPTSDHQPEFCWHQVMNRRDRRGKLFVHEGQPDCFNYQWQPMPPKP
jgi:hypothetical protein